MSYYVLVDNITYQSDSVRILFDVKSRGFTNVRFLLGGWTDYEDNLRANQLVFDDYDDAITYALSTGSAISTKPIFLLRNLSAL